MAGQAGKGGRKICHRFPDVLEQERWSESASAELLLTASIRVGRALVCIVVCIFRGGTQKPTEGAGGGQLNPTRNRRACESEDPRIYTHCFGWV